MTRRLLGEFDAPGPLLLAARALREASVHRVADAFTPFPVEGLAETIDASRPTRLPLAMLAGGLAGASGGLLLQWVSATRILPVLAGGRADASWPDFVFACFELAILGAALAGFASLLIGCGLPRLHHPLFDVPGFERATQDRFFLEVETASSAEAAEARARLHALGALRVEDVPR